MFVDGKQVLLVQPAGMEPPPLLRALGLRVTVANDAAAAIEIAGRDEHDMAMIDAAIAGEGDTSLPARMRRATAVPSVVVLVEAGDVRRAIRLLAAGADDYLVKPL